MSFNNEIYPSKILVFCYRPVSVVVEVSFGSYFKSIMCYYAMGYWKRFTLKHYDIVYSNV